MARRLFNWPARRLLTLFGTALCVTSAPACVQPVDAQVGYEPMALADSGMWPTASRWVATHRLPSSTRWRRRRMAWQSP